LNIKGAAEAIELYKKAFGAEERVRMPGPDNSIMHAELKIGTSMIMIADALRNPPTQSSCHLYLEDVDGAWARATGAGLQVAMPLANMFWGDRYGVLTDKFGNRWGLSCHIEDVSPEEMRKRMAAEMQKA
jgi:uncharacterized glyoxalase superfamily protein PhnB